MTVGRQIATAYRVTLTRFALVSAGIVALPTAAAQCPERWTPNLFPGPRGLSAIAYAAIEFDDGSGQRLFVGGPFRLADGLRVKGVAAWTGENWSTVGDGLGPTVTDFVVFDDGTGPALYATGNFGLCVARWNGTTWELLPGSPYGGGLCLAVQDFGDGPRLFVGGSFNSAPTGPMRGIAMWDGQAWHEVGGGIGAESGGPDVKVILPVNDEHGPGIYVAGTFASAGPIQVGNIARWNGAEWSWLGDGVSAGSGTPTINTLHAHDDGPEAALYVGGRFDFADGADTRNLARWDGSSWSSVGQPNAFGGSGCVVNSIVSFDDGGGPALYVGGDFTCAASTLAARCIARLDAATWVGVADAEGVPIQRLVARQSPEGARLLLLGANDRELRLFDGSSIALLGPTDDVLVEALAPLQNDQGNLLAVGGQFSRIAGTLASNVAVWDGENWFSLGSGVNGRVRAACWYDDGAEGAKLIVGGDFTEAGGVPASRVAQWDGAQWSALGDGFANSVNALAVWNRPEGPQLFAAGKFNSNPAGRIARWDGAMWQPLGSGVNNWVQTLAIFDDGSGEALYAGGYFTLAGGQQVRTVARWNGVQWAPVGAGLFGCSGACQVSSLAVFDDGGGAKLYAVGPFEVSGSTPIRHFARWDGSSWSEVAGGTHQAAVRLHAHELASGPALVVAGIYIRLSPFLGGAAAWNGQTWTDLIETIDGHFSAFATFDDGRGPALFGGGDFKAVDGDASGGIARYGPQPPLAGDIDQNCRVGLPDLALMLAAFSTCEGTPGFDPALDIVADGCIDLADLALLLGQFGMLA